MGWVIKRVPVITATGAGENVKVEFKALSILHSLMTKMTNMSYLTIYDKQSVKKGRTNTKKNIKKDSSS